MNALLLKAAPYVGIAALLGIGRCRDVQHQRAIGAANERLHIADSTLRVVRRDALRLDTVYRVDTMRFTRTLVRRDTVLRTVDRYIRENVPVPVDVVREVLKADSAAIQSCTFALSTCEQRVSNAERRAALLAQQTRDLKLLIPNQLTANAKVGAAIVVGFALCKYVLCPKPE